MEKAAINKIKSWATTTIVALWHVPIIKNALANLIARYLVRFGISAALILAFGDTIVGSSL